MPRSNRTSGMTRDVGLAIALLVLGVYGAGCQSVVVVPLRVKVESPLDLNRYSSFAVVPIVDRDGRLGTEQLYALSNMVRQRLERVEGISLLAQSETLNGLSGEDVSAECLDDPERIAEWGRMLGVSALVTGRVRYYVFNDIQTRPVEWWDFRQGRYVSEVQTYLVRSHHISLDLSARDANTGQVLAGDDYSNEWNQPQSVVGVVVRELSGSSTVLFQLAEDPIREFLGSIASSFEYEERYLLR